MKKLWYIYTVEYHSAIIRNKTGLSVIMFKLLSIHPIPTLDSSLGLLEMAEHTIVNSRHVRGMEVISHIYSEP